MAIEYTLSDADTVQGLAAKYNVAWQDIVDFNALEYPYTLTSRDAYNLLYAGGYITVTRQLFTSALTIYAGSTFTTELDNQGIQKVYEVVEDTIFPAGVATGYLYVRCIIYGTFGNCITGAIIQTGQVRTNLGLYVSQLVVTNEQPFTNGTDAHVILTGQSIFIPTAGATEVPVLSDSLTYLNTLGGEDIALAQDGDITDDGYGDLGSVVGMDNIQQACYVRLMTRRGSITQHPEYGSTLHTLIGKAQAPYIRKLMELDIHETLSYDDRLEAVAINSVDIQGTSIYVDITITVNKTTTAFSTVLSF
jgi:phage baseplate assembly protein W